MEIRCPFVDHFPESHSCVYLNDVSCNEFEINRGNSDAWCYDKKETTDMLLKNEWR